VVQRAQDGKLKVRTSMLAMAVDGVEVVCRRCNGAVRLPLELGDELRKALSDPLPPKKRRLVLRKPLDLPKSVT